MRTVLSVPEWGNLWLTADSHFFHTNIIRYCGRPFTSVEEMNETLLQRWNVRVAPEDTVLHLGDFALGKAEQVVPFRRRLNGRVVLIRGNHDRFGKATGDALGFQVVEGQAELRVGEKVLLLSHEPDFTPVQPGQVKFCGHVHEHWRCTDFVVNVGVDVWGFKPISIEEALAAL